MRKRERNKEREIESVCVYVCEREKECVRERDWNEKAKETYE